MDIDKLAKRLQKEYKKMGTWNAVAEYYRLTKPLVWRIANRHYEPKKPYIRHRLGLPALVPAPVCLKCGQVHITKRCTLNHSYRSLFAMPAQLLRRAMEMREEI
jgi:hypothetical protein